MLPHQARPHPAVGVFSAPRARRAFPRHARSRQAHRECFPISTPVCAQHAGLRAVTGFCPGRNCSPRRTPPLRGDDVECLPTFSPRGLPPGLFENERFRCSRPARAAVIPSVPGKKAFFPPRFRKKIMKNEKICEKSPFSSCQSRALPIQSLSSCRGSSVGRSGD